MKQSSANATSSSMSSSFFGTCHAGALSQDRQDSDNGRMCVLDPDAHTFEELLRLLVAKHEQVRAENRILVRTNEALTQQASGLHGRDTPTKSDQPPVRTNGNGFLRDCPGEKDVEDNMWNGEAPVATSTWGRSVLRWPVPTQHTPEAWTPRMNGVQKVTPPVGIPTKEGLGTPRSSSNGNHSARSHNTSLNGHCRRPSVEILERMGSIDSDIGESGFGDISGPISERSRTSQTIAGSLWRRKSSRRITFKDNSRRTRRRKFQWVINPEQSSLLQNWDKITMAALAFVAIVTPVQVSMMDASVEVNALFVWNIFVDFIFFVDMCLQFFIMYPLRTSYGYVLEHRHCHIARHYFKSWFFIDFLSILPFDMVGFLVDSDDVRQLKVLKIVRLMRLLKLVRMLKAKRVFRRLEVRMSVTYQRLALVKFFVLLMLVTHWMANLWALTLMLVDEDEGLPRWVDSITELEDNVKVKTKDSAWKLYITCFYFTSYTITSVGYGDIGPANILERIVCTFMIFASGISWALVLAQVTSIIGHMDSEEQCFRKMMDELNFFMEDRSLPGIMRRRLRSFILSNKNVRRRSTQLQVLDRMTPTVKGEVCYEIHKIWLSKVGFLRELVRTVEAQGRGRLRDLLVELSQCLRTEVHAQGELFGKHCTLYVVSRGLAARVARVFGQGSYWGFDAFLLSEASSHLIEPAKTFALTYMELQVLDLANFNLVLDRHKVIVPRVRVIMRHFTIWLAFQRTILREARIRKYCATDDVR